MTTSDVIQLAGVAVTFGAVVVALYHKKLDEVIYGKPKLIVVEPEENPVDARKTYYHRVLVRNMGKRAANGVRAFIRSNHYPNPIYGRWSGMIREDQKRIDIPPGEACLLDVFAEVRGSPKQEGWGTEILCIDAVEESYPLSRPNEGSTLREHTLQVHLSSETDVLARYGLLIRMKYGEKTELKVVRRLPS